MFIIIKQLPIIDLATDAYWCEYRRCVIETKKTEHILRAIRAQLKYTPSFR